MDNTKSINQIDSIINNEQNTKLKESNLKTNNKFDLNDSDTHFPSFQESLSAFQRMLLEAERELNNSSIKQSESIKSFEAKINIPINRFNSNTSINTPISNRLNRRKSSVTERKSKSKLLTNQQSIKNKQINKSADSDDEKSKKKVLNGSIIEKRNKLSEKLNLDNANEHFTLLLRVRNEAKLIELVKMHLLLLIDLDGENFSNMFDNEQTNKKSNAIKKKKQDNKSNDKGLFQQTLTEEGICRLYLLTDFIGIPKNINQEGIFRKCGSTARQQELKYRLQKNISLELETGKYTVHDCTNVLKTCLSEMPEPLLTDLFFKIIAQKLVTNENNANRCFTESDFNDIFGDKNLKVIQLILLLIPLKRRKFANDLLNLLNKIASTENSTNKMNAKSLATLFAPHLLCPKSMSPIDLQRYITLLTMQLEFMILNVKQIFKTPIELTLDIRKELEKMDKSNNDEEEDDGISTVVTFCDRKAVVETNQTEQHIAQLYAHIQSLPDTPAKRKLVKRFNGQNGGLTPQIDKENSKKKQNRFKTIGEKFKNAKNLFTKPINNNPIKNKREDSNQQLIDGNDEIDNRNLKMNTINELKSRSNYMKTSVNDQYFLAPSPNKSLLSKDTPLSDLTATKFCIDDEDTDELMYHKKIYDYNSDTNESSQENSPWASDSFKV